MLNLLKSELYQISHRKTTRIWLAIAAFFSAGIVVIPKLLHFRNTPAELYLTGYTGILLGGFVLLILGLVTASFNNELKNRTLINSVSHGYSRSTIYAVKFISALAFSAFALLLSVTFFTAALQLLEPTKWDHIWYFYKTIASLLPIWVAYISLYVLISFFSETNTPMYILLSLLLVVFPIVFQLGSNVEIIAAIKPYFLTELSFTDPYTLFGLDGKFVMSLFYIALFYGLGVLYFKRKEIK
ncbi:MAG: ABC transporter permease subunit [Aerococcaceae bacterium]|nr:ABC transporter permease subunit [Aerococcaceae bacterium]